MMYFPIYRLNGAITEALKKIISLDIAKGIREDLDPMIHFVDEQGGPLSTIAKITERSVIMNENESKRYITISATYSQILWMICSIVMRNHDSVAINSEIERMSQEEYTKYQQELLSDTIIARCEILVSKRYRNRRLGEYLKELDLTEGRSTGIPTIQNVLENNGSPRATIVTDEERTFFRITIPCHEAAGNIIADIAHKDGSLKASKRGVLKTGLKSGLESRLKSGLKSGLKILEHIQNNPQSTLVELAKQTGYSRSWVAETMKRLQEQGIIKRIGSDKSGYWEIVDKDEQYSQ